ncbi:MAG: glycosyltransferase family 2 protein [Pyrinomonadaceae bacterium]
MQISIVIPTYNRPDQLKSVLKHLLASDTEGFDNVEIIVVDDGSKESARHVVESFDVRPPFNLAYVFQENTGPAEARNHGFRLAKNEIVLFIDDDILVFPDLIRNHFLAHSERKGAVFFGQCPYLVPEIETPAYRYLAELNDQGIAALDHLREGRFIRLDTIASGNISFEKSMFTDTGEVYGRDLTIAAGEEFELALRLMKKRIAVFMMPDTKGWHLQPATIADSCKQNYRYGKGVAEVITKMPETLTFPPVANLYLHNNPIQPGDPISLKTKKSIRRLLTPIRGALLDVATIMEKILPDGKVLYMVFRTIVSTYFVAGLRDGMREFGESGISHT